jgi:hypothetical protein
VPGVVPCHTVSRKWRGSPEWSKLSLLAVSCESPDFRAIPCELSHTSLPTAAIMSSSLTGVHRIPWLTHCATSRKVAGSISDGVFETSR